MKAFDRFRRAFFKENIEEKAESISKSLLEVQLEKAEKTIREQIYGMTNGDYHDNLLREILPVVTRADNKIKDNEDDIKVIKEACTELIGKLEKIEQKKKDFDKTFDYISRSPWANSYVLYKSKATNELLLINNQYNTHNKTFNEYKYPAVVAIDLFTNEISQKYLFDDLWEDVRYPRNATEMMQNYIAASENLNFTTPEDITKARQIIENSLNNSAEQIQMLFEEKKKEMGILSKEYRTKSVFETAIDLVEKERRGGNRDVNYFPHTNQISFRKDNNAVILNYCEECITSAYYATRYGKVFKVYDIKEADRGNNGFLNLSDSTYRYIISNEPFTKFMGLENLAVDDKVQKTELEFKFIGERKYERSEVGIIEPDNPRFIYGMETDDELEDRLKSMFEKICEIEQAYKEANVNAKVDYNPFNNSINIENNRETIILTFSKDKDAPFDIYYKTQFEYNRDSDAVVVDGRIVNQTVYDSNEFNLLFSAIKDKVFIREDVVESIEDADRKIINFTKLSEKEAVKEPRKTKKKSEQSLEFQW